MKKSELFEALAERVLALDLPPGAPLDESALCAAYGVSRTPLREALQMLGGAGYVTLTPNRGAVVSSMDLATMRNFFQSAPMIYAAIARLAAENATPEGVETLGEIQEKFRAAFAGERPREMAAHNHRFHRAIAEMAASPYLGPSFDRLLIDHTRMSQRFYAARTAEDRRRIETASAQHEAMIAAFEMGEGARAVELTLEHWALSRDRIERYVRPDALPLDPTRGFDPLAEKEARHAI